MQFVERSEQLLDQPILVEGLPGVGNVGKLAAQHLVESLGATLWFDIFSHDFPPQVLVSEGKIKLVRNQLWVVPADGDAPPVVILTGDYQPMSSTGQWELVEEVLNRIEAMGCTTMYTLGGFGLGAEIEEPEVVGAATDDEMLKSLEEDGVRFEDDEPAGGIIGASGLFLGIGKERGMRGACLMGETNGYMVDPTAAEAVLKVLGKRLNRDIDVADLTETAGELDRITQQMQEAETAAREPTDLHYIG